MGLDMYLSKRTYIGANFDHNQIKGGILLTKNGRPINITPNRVSNIIEAVGYWRKANAIHHWFVENIQAGEDDCRQYEVSLAKLQDLKSIITKILSEEGNRRKELAQKYLPPSEGFFFGSMDIDDWYWKDLEYTFELLTKVEKEQEEADKNDIWVDWIYQSSW